MDDFGQRAGEPGMPASLLLEQLLLKVLQNIVLQNLCALCRRLPFNCVIDTGTEDIDLSSALVVGLLGLRNHVAKKPKCREKTPVDDAFRDNNVVASRCS